MKFAEIEYIKENDKQWVSDFIMKLPRVLRDKYFLIFAPLRIEEFEVAGESGYKITWPLNADKMDYNLQLRMIKKTTAFLMDKEINVIINKNLIPMPTEYIQARGGLAISYYISELIKNYCDNNGVDLANAKVVVRDGKNLETFIVLKKLLGEVNYLSICTTDKRSFDNYYKDAYEETGLVTEFFANAKGSFMKNADIVINCSADMENFDYILKKDSLYIEASPIKGKLKRLMMRRGDLDFIYDLNTKYNNDTLNAAYTEAIFIIKCSNMAKAIKNFGDGNNQDGIIGFLDALNIDLEARLPHE